jgi:hypothetical protein
MPSETLRSSHWRRREIPIKAARLNARPQDFLAVFPDTKFGRPGAKVTIGGKVFIVMDGEWLVCEGESVMAYSDEKFRRTFHLV